MVIVASCEPYSFCHKLAPCWVPSPSCKVDNTVLHWYSRVSNPSGPLSTKVLCSQVCPEGWCPSARLWRCRTHILILAGGHFYLLTMYHKFRFGQYLSLVQFWGLNLVHWEARECSIISCPFSCAFIRICNSFIYIFTAFFLRGSSPPLPRGSMPPARWDSLFPNSFSSPHLSHSCFLLSHSQGSMFFSFWILPCTFSFLSRSFLSICMCLGGLKTALSCSHAGIIV